MASILVSRSGISSESTELPSVRFRSRKPSPSNTEEAVELASLSGFAWQGTAKRFSVTVTSIKGISEIGVEGSFSTSFSGIRSDCL